MDGGSDRSDAGPAGAEDATGAGSGGADPGQRRPSPFQPVPGAGRARRLPLLDQLTGYRSLRPDVLAGIMVAAIALPQAMAYAQTAGLLVVVGLYGLLLPVVAYSLLGSSRVLMVGPTTIAALMVGPALVAVSPDPSAYPALAAMLALLVALVFLAGRLAHLGWLADYFSSAALLGFVTGVALTLIAGQIGVLVGVPVTGENPLQQYASFGTAVAVTCTPRQRCWGSPLWSCWSSAAAGSPVSRCCWW